MTDPTSDLKSMRRRRYLSYLAVGGLGVGGGWVLFGDGEVPGRGRISGAVQTTLSGDIDGVEWDGQLLHIDFAEGTSAGLFGIMHEFHEDPVDARYSDEVPEFGGRVSVDFREVVPGREYPSNGFAIVVYEGEPGPFVSAVEKELSRVTVQVPEENFAAGTFDA